MLYINGANRSQEVMEVEQKQEIIDNIKINNNIPNDITKKSDKWLLIYRRRESENNPMISELQDCDKDNILIFLNSKIYFVYNSGVDLDFNSDYIVNIDSGNRSINFIDNNSNSIRYFVVNSTGNFLEVRYIHPTILGDFRIDIYKKIPN